jgi:hypothetical protein
MTSYCDNPVISITSASRNIFIVESFVSADWTSNCQSLNDASGDRHSLWGNCTEIRAISPMASANGLSKQSVELADESIEAGPVLTPSRTILELRRLLAEGNSRR